ncbi:MAG: type II toxin-antitoxin system VapC family toxin [Candidatus Sericytochromatia bacterium]|nr:type II toxin-antitoxin system VapC family toxin [Candidatus Sericytochromatia bacterium]
MRLLLDTHALLWWLAGDARLTSGAREAIADLRHEVFVSAASAWEVSTKHRLGKLPGAGPLVVDFPREVLRQGFVPLPVTLGHGQLAGSLEWAHRDPFDRMLVAQAREERLALVSNEASFDGLGIVRVW